MASAPAAIPATLWSLNLNSLAWSRLAPSGAPRSTFGHAVAVAGSDMFVFGGASPATLLASDQLLQYKSVDNTW